MGSRSHTPYLRIGALAKQANCAVETIRYYEREGLLPDAYRSTNNYRLYTSLHKERLCFIRRCRALDMTLDEIRALLSVRDTTPDQCSQVSALIRDHLHHVEARIEELGALRKQLMELQSHCGEEQHGEHCAILTLLELPDKQLTLPSPHAGHLNTHVSGSQ